MAGYNTVARPRAKWLNNSKSSVRPRLPRSRILSAGSNFDLTNLDRWYERDAGEQVGDYVLYR